MAAIEHAIHLMFEALSDLHAVSEWQVVSRQQQCGAHDGLAEFCEQHARHFMIWNTNANRAAFFVLQASRRFLGGWQEKGIRTRRGCLEHAELPGFHPGVACDLGQIAANQREMVLPICLTNAPDAIERGLVTNVTAERVAGIRRIHDEAAAAHDFGRAPDQPHLRIVGMEFEILAHGFGPRQARETRRGADRYHTRPVWQAVRMQTFAEFVPWIVFGVVYKFWGGIYPATIGLMASMALLLAFDWLTTRKIPQMHVVLAVLVWVFGAATLILHDVRFLQWKASVFYWLLGLAFAVSVWIGKQTLLERLLAKGLPEEVKIPASSWRNMSLLAGVFYLALGTANIWVALTMSESAWVTFKVWISFPVVLVFTFGMIFWLLRDLFKKGPTP